MLADAHQCSHGYADKDENAGKLMKRKDELSNLHGESWVEERSKTSDILKAVQCLACKVTNKITWTQARRTIENPTHE